MHRTSSATPPGAIRPPDNTEAARVVGISTDAPAGTAHVQPRANQPNRQTNNHAHDQQSDTSANISADPAQQKAHSQSSTQPSSGLPVVFAGIDAATIRSAIRGDAASRERLWMSVRPWIVALVLAHKPRHADVEDLVQEVAARFVRSLSTVADPGAFAGWIRTVTINTARTAGRKARTAPPTSPTTFSDAESSVVRSAATSSGFPHHRAAAAEDRRNLLERVAQLPEMYREPLLLRSARGLSSAQIGVILGLSPVAVDTRLARARRMLLENQIND